LQDASHVYEKLTGNPKKQLFASHSDYFYFVGRGIEVKIKISGVWEDDLWERLLAAMASCRRQV